MIDDAQILVEALSDWNGPVRLIPGDGAHVLLLESDHTQSRLASWDAWEAVRPTLVLQEDGCYTIAA